MFDADVIVVGSGFGGAVTALRCAQGGKKVIVLERGRRYAAFDFPRDSSKAQSIFWRYPNLKDWLGLYELRAFSGFAAVVASGVGGGSLVYANVLVRPDDEVFQDVRWPSGIDRAMLEPYYDEVLDMLDATRYPQDEIVDKRTRFRAAAAQLGIDVYDPPQAVHWAKSHAGDPRTPCQRCASCELACTFGAKNTLDLTYLAQAEKLGARIVTDAGVSHVEPFTDGGYRVAFEDINTWTPQSLTAKRVVLAAGTLGTLSILFKSRDAKRTLPNVSATLGRGISCNGDYFGTLQNAKDPIAPHIGTDVTSIMRVRRDGHAYTVVAPSFNQDAMRFLASLGQPTGSPLPPFTDFAWTQLDTIVAETFAAGLARGALRVPMPNAGPPDRMTNLFAIGRDNAGGRAVWKRGHLDIEWDYASENAALVGAMDATLSGIAHAYGGTYAPLATWSFFKRPVTVHPLGGAALSDTPASGVVSADGEVHGHPELFIADGAIVPTSLGVHPAATIAALAEHISRGVAARA